LEVLRNSKSENWENWAILQSFQIGGLFLAPVKMHLLRPDFLEQIEALGSVMIARAGAAQPYRPTNK